MLMFMLMTGLVATIAAATKSASTLHQTVTMGGTLQTTCAAAIGKEEAEEEDDTNASNKTMLPPPPPQSAASSSIAQRMPFISKSTSSSLDDMYITPTCIPSEPTNPTAPSTSQCTCVDEMHRAIAIAHVPTLLITNALQRRKDHEQYRLLLEKQHQAHQSEMLNLHQHMDFTVTNLQDQVTHLRNAIDQMQEGQKLPPPPSLRAFMMSSSTSLYDRLQLNLPNISNSNSEEQYAIFLVTIFLLLPILLVVLFLKTLNAITKGGPSKQKKRTARPKTNSYSPYMYSHRHPTSPTSTPIHVPPMPHLSGSDSCSSPSLGSMHSKSSPATPCPSYIAIPAVHRRMTTAMAIEQMARDAEDQYMYPRGSHLPLPLPLPPPPLIPPLDRQEDAINATIEPISNVTKSDYVLKRKARILSRRLRTMAKKMRTSRAIRFLLGMTFPAFLAKCLINVAPSNWKPNGLPSSNGVAHPLRLLIELIITFSVSLAAGYLLHVSYCSTTKDSTKAAARAFSKRSTVRRHRSLICGPSNVRSNASSSSSSRSAVFRRQRRQSKRSLFARSQLE